MTPKKPASKRRQIETTYYDKLVELHEKEAREEDFLEEVEFDDDDWEAPGEIPPTLESEEDFAERINEKTLEFCVEKFPDDKIICREIFRNVKHDIKYPREPEEDSGSADARGFESDADYREWRDRQM